MQRYAIRFTRAAGFIVSTLTGRRAVRLYRVTWQSAVLTLQVAAAVILILGAAIFALGWLTRLGVTQHSQAVENLVDRCLEPPAEVPVALLPARAEVEPDPWDLPDPPLIPPVLITLPPTPLSAPLSAPLLLLPAAPEPKGKPRRKKAEAKPTSEQPKRKRGRPRKQAVA